MIEILLFVLAGPMKSVKSAWMENVGKYYISQERRGSKWTISEEFVSLPGY